MPRCLLSTGQQSCYDVPGKSIPCRGSGQDGEYARGAPWPEPRFEVRGDEVRDRLTGLYWLRDASVAGFPLDWRESLEFIAALNRKNHAGRNDWRLPNRRELRSLASHGVARPSLPEQHPFVNVEQTWYWSSTTAAINPAYAWYLNMEGARMFYGAKDQYFLLWPVRGAGNSLLPKTGQVRCYDSVGDEIACDGSGQDGEYTHGAAWPAERFAPEPAGIVDRLTGLVWQRNADLAGGAVSWSEALQVVAQLNETAGSAVAAPWRLPNINELESLVDCSCSQPALPAGHPFNGVRDTYWSSTSSAYESDWAWALYLDKGACGVGRKEGRYFRAWAVRDASGEGSPCG